MPFINTDETEYVSGPLTRKDRRLTGRTEWPSHAHLFGIVAVLGCMVGLMWILVGGVIPHLNAQLTWSYILVVGLAFVAWLGPPLVGNYIMSERPQGTAARRAAAHEAGRLVLSSDPTFQLIMTDDVKDAIRRGNGIESAIAEFLRVYGAHGTMEGLFGAMGDNPLDNPELWMIADYVDEERFMNHVREVQARKFAEQLADARSRRATAMADLSIARAQVELASGKVDAAQAAVEEFSTKVAQAVHQVA